MRFVTPNGKKSQTAKVDGYILSHQNSSDNDNEKTNFTLDASKSTVTNKKQKGVVVNLTLDASEADSIEDIEILSDDESFTQEVLNWEEKIKRSLKTCSGEYLGLHHPQTGEIVYINEAPDYIET